MPGEGRQPPGMAEWLDSCLTILDIHVPGVQVFDGLLAGIDPDRPAHVRVWRRDADDARVLPGPLVAMVMLPGSGWHVGGTEMLVGSFRIEAAALGEHRA